MTSKMNDDSISFASGSLLAAIPALNWLWPLQFHGIDASNLAFLWVIKIFGTIILGFLGGLTGMLGKDFYRFLKYKLKQNDKQDQGGDS